MGFFQGVHKVSVVAWSSCLPCFHLPDDVCFFFPVHPSNHSLCSPSSLPSPNLSRSITCRVIFKANSYSTRLSINPYPSPYSKLSSRCPIFSPNLNFSINSNPKPEFHIMYVLLPFRKFPLPHLNPSHLSPSHSIPFIYSSLCSASFPFLSLLHLTRINSPFSFTRRWVGQVNK